MKRALVWRVALVAALPRVAIVLLVTSAAFGQEANPGVSSAGSGIQPLDLAQVEELAIQRNLGLIAARYQIDVARADHLTAALRPNPVFSSTNENFKFSRPLDGINGDFVDYTQRLDVILERGGKRGLRVQAAEQGVRLAEARFLDELRRLRLRVRQTFYNALLASTNLDLAAGDLENFQRIESITKVRVDAGDAAQVDLLKIELEREQLVGAMAAARLAHEQALVDLRGLIGERLDPTLPTQVPTIVLTGALAAPSVELELATLKQQALTRPDVAAAKTSVEAARSQLLLAQAGRRQDLDIFVEYKRTNGFDTFGGGFSIPLPLFNRNQGAIARAQATLAADTSALGQAELDALVEVEKAFRGYAVNLAEARRYRENLADKATRVRRITEISYQEGQASLLELLDATRTYNQIRLAQNHAEFAYRMSLVELEAATGQPVVPGP